MLVCLLMRLHCLLICLVRTAALIYILSHTLSLIPSQTRRILCHLMHYGRQQPRIQIEVLGHLLVRSLVRSHRSLAPLTRTAHSFTCSGLLASLTPSAALTRLLACSLCSLPRSWESEFLISPNDLVLSHSASVPPSIPLRYSIVDALWSRTTKNTD